jgi:hypothetical protein
MVMPRKRKDPKLNTPRKGVRKRSPEAARIEADYKSKKRSIDRQESSARAGQTGRGFGIDKGKYTTNAVGAQEPDPGAPSRASYSDTRRTPPALRKSDTPAKSRISKKKPKTEREYDAKKKLSKDKTPQDTPTFNTNKPASKAPKADKGKRKRVTPKTSTAKATSSRAANQGSRPKRPDNYVSAADRDLIENPKKKKRKAPTYRG